MNRQALRRELIRDEGSRAKPYRDSLGIWTVGVGRNLQATEFTPEEIDLMLATDMARCEADLISFPWFVKLDDVRQRACLNMRFNLGARGFRSFRMFIAAMEMRDYVRASQSLLNSKAAAQTGQRYVRLAKMVRDGVELA